MAAAPPYFFDLFRLSNPCCINYQTSLSPLEVKLASDDTFRVVLGKPLSCKAKAAFYPVNMLIEEIQHILLDEKYDYINHSQK